MLMALSSQGIPLVFKKTRRIEKKRDKNLILRLNKAKTLKRYRLKLFVDEGVPLFFFKTRAGMKKTIKI